MANVTINSLTAKTTPVDADVTIIVDSAASNDNKKLSWANIKATLKTYFDTLYAGALGADENYVTDAQLVVIGNTSGTNTGDNATNTQYSGLAASKQDTLVSGTNIKTINSTSLLGSGDIAISGAVSDGDKGDITVSGSGTVWNIDAATVGLTELSATGTPTSSNFLRGDNTWATPAGSGDVSKVGTPVNNQVGIWTGDGTIEGDSALTFDTASDTLAGMSVITGASTGLSINTATNGGIIIDPSGSGSAILRAGSGGVTVTTTAGNSNINITPHGTGEVIMSTARVSDLTASEIIITDASKNLVSAAVATYPSLTELTYVKGLTSSAQTQLSSKQSTISFGTGVQTALGVNVGSAGAPVLFNGALGTPSSGTVTNLTGTASININGTVGATTPTTGSFTTVTTSGNIELGNASDTTISRTGAGAIAVEGVGVALNSTSLVHTASQYEVGNATDTTISRVSAGVIAVEGVTVPTISSTSTITNKRNQPRVVSAASYTTDTGTSLDVSTCDLFVITAQAGALLFNAPSGTPVQGERLVIRIKDNGTARALTWNAVFRAMGTALPSTTVLSKTLYLGFMYNSTDSTWDLVASAQQA